MRLLRREEHGELSLTEFLGDETPPYAILSHTWGKDSDEVTFNDLNKNCGKDKIGYCKIQFCEKQAANDGLQHFWVDTCCIDKASSSELTEAINSMFRWYRNAAKCYVYLADVSFVEEDTEEFTSNSWELSFRQSRWFTRGWTLQELIAPASVDFFSREGERIGDKRSLEHHIHEITGVSVEALRGNPLSKFSVAERISWAAKRKTRRKEDEAYSLLGIFDVHIPLIYGEGERAFSRLREEIDKQSNVHSRSEVQHWLSPSNVLDDLEKHVEDCMPGSCDWVLTSPKVRSFLSSTSPVIAHIQGRPGAGKSTTVSYVIKHLQSSHGPTVLYFFCNANDAERRQPIHVLRTILSQLLRADERLYPVIREIYIQSGRAKADSLTEMEAALVLAFTLANIKDRQIFIIIDALDECENVSKLVGSIARCMTSTRITMRILFASRPMSLNVVSQGCEINLDHVKSTPEFIEAYIAKRVNENKNLRRSDLGKRVVAKVSKAADGLWLYARLMMDEIDRLASSVLIERQLQGIPHGLTQLYTQVLRSSERNFSPEQIKFAQQIFLWLDIDDYLPGFLNTGYQGLSYKTLSLVLQYVNFGQPVFDPIALTRELCSPLVEVTEIPFKDQLFLQPDLNRRSARPRDFELKYDHHTAKQYILESFASPLNDLPLLLRPRRFRFFQRAAVAVWYFSECPDSKDHLRSLQAEPGRESWEQVYFDMAYGIWGALKLSEFETTIYPEEMADLTQVVGKLIDFINSTKCLVWVETAIAVNYSARFYHLLLNATEALTATLRMETHGITVWNDFQKARLHFLANYRYVLSLTGPPLLTRNHRNPDPESLKPEGFDRDPIARTILKMGKHYAPGR